MINVCPNCGHYRADKDVDSEHDTVRCPECGDGCSFRIGSLACVGGPAGAGKTSVLLELIRRDLPIVLLDTDALWSPTFDKPETDYRAFFEAWLRVAKNIS